MSNNSKTKHIKYDIYKQPIFTVECLYVCKQFDEDSINRNFCNNDNTPIDTCFDGFLGCTYYGIINKKTKEPCILVVFDEQFLKKNKKNIPELVGLINHEALHVAHRILQSSDIDLTDDTKEVFAYTVEWASKSIAKTIFKK